MDISVSNSSNPHDHVKKVQEIITSMKEHCRSESGRLTDTRARALLETTADVFDGLEKAFLDYLANTDSWQKKDFSGDFPQKSDEPWD